MKSDLTPLLPNKLVKLIFPSDDGLMHLEYERVKKPVTLRGSFNMSHSFL